MDVLVGFKLGVLRDFIEVKQWGTQEELTASFVDPAGHEGAIASIGDMCEQLYSV